MLICFKRYHDECSSQLCWRCALPHSNSNACSPALRWRVRPQIDIYPQNSSCLYLSTYMQIVRANATQIAFISVSDYVGTSQSPAQ